MQPEVLQLMLGGFFLCDKGSDKYSIPCKKYDGSARCLQYSVCKSARNTMYISADGRLLPCIPLTGTEIQDEMPDILETGLIEALSDSRYLKLIDMRLEDILRENEECNQCEHRLYCGGGCRATALDLQRPVYRD
jgi:radical SAM protein with 4Fe4S-binding SPASM domain